MKPDIDTKYLERKLIFIVNRLEYLKRYSSLTIAELSENFERIKSVEKVIQEVVDCAVDINQYLAENVLNTEIISSKDSFWKMQRLLKKEDEYFKKIVDTVSFRNEIVHSYDAGIKMVWKTRNVGYFVDIYREYLEDLNRLITQWDEEDSENCSGKYRNRLVDER